MLACPLIEDMNTTLRKVTKVQNLGVIPTCILQDSHACKCVGVNKNLMTTNLQEFYDEKHHTPDHPLKGL